MNITHEITLLRWNIPPRKLGLISVLTLAVGASETLLFYGHVWYSLWAYALLVVLISLAPLFIEDDVGLLQAFVLIPVFRLVNFAMPVFFEQTLFWLLLVYAPFVPVFVYLGRQTDPDTQPAGRRDESFERSADRRLGQRPSTESAPINQNFPWWLGGTRGNRLRTRFERVWHALTVPEGASFQSAVLHRAARGLLIVVISLGVGVFLVLMGVLTVYLAEVGSDLTPLTPLIPSLTGAHIATLTVVMVFVGFVEEVLFRGILQKVLERNLGLVPGLLLASSLFALIYSAHGVPIVLVYAGGLGLLFGVIYDVTDSLVLVSCMHGLLNVFLFGVIPLGGPTSADLVHAFGIRGFPQFGIQGVVQPVTLLDFLFLVGGY